MSGNDGMEKLIPIVNKLQDAFTSSGLPLSIDLPQIAVVGSQSAGKSSVLENFVGKDFLPRGSGICTRRPLVLQLIYSPTEYAEFLHTKNKVFYDFDAVRQEIEDDTEKIAGESKGVSHLPINLRVYSPHVLNLTLVDLPGMTRVPLPGQPADIADQIRNMILEFITSPNCLILAVSPANSDLANSDALKIAKEVDPQGVRTIGVITKLDLMDEGTDAKEILENKLLPLRRGYVGVVNRSQRDIDGKKDIKAALEAERKFFIGHPSYRHLIDQMGTPYLQKTLNQQLTNHIRDALPPLRNKLHKQMISMQKEVVEINQHGSNDSKGMTKNMMSLLNQFSENLKESIDGTGQFVSTKELCGGAKINKIFHERFPFELMKIKFNEKQIQQEIQFAIMNIYAIRTGLFTPDMAFERVVRDRIDAVRYPTLLIVDLVIEKLKDIIVSNTSKMASFPNLRDDVENRMNQYMMECELKVKDALNMQIDCHLAYINTNHDDFVGFAEAKRNAEEGVSSQSNIDEVLQRGWMSLSTGRMFKGSTEFWFVLTTKTLSWFKDDEEKDKKHTFLLDNLKLKESESGFMGAKRPSFTLFNEEGRNVYKEFKEIELSPEIVNDVDDWKASFVKAGVRFDFQHDENINQHSDLNGSNNPVMDKQVAKIRSLVESYLKIILKTHKDMVPKIIMHLLINEVKKYIEGELLVHLCTSDISLLMKESDDKLRRREETIVLFSAIKDCLKIIGDVTTSTISTPLPPPIKNDWLEPAKPASPGTGNRRHPSPSSHSRGNPPPDNIAVPPRPIRTAPTAPKPLLPTRSS